MLSRQNGDIMQLEPIHISFTGGSRGEYLSAIVYTAYFRKLPNYEINDDGKMRIRHEKQITKLHKQVCTQSSLRVDKVSKRHLVSTVFLKRKPFIGISHYAAQLHNLLDEDFDRNCYVVKILQKTPVIVIEHEEDDIPNIAMQSSKKNREHNYEELILRKDMRWLRNCKSYFDNFAYVHYKDLTTDLPKVLNIISSHTGHNLEYNDCTEILQKEYIEKNKIYGVDDRT